MNNSGHRPNMPQGGNFSFSHKLGQNFLVDPDVCPRIADYYDDKQTGILEIGPGAGALTAELAKRAGKVAAIEIDRRLEPVLNKSLKGYGNVEIIFGDVMKLDLAEILQTALGGFEKKAVCANLPYYITSPVIMKLLEERLPVDSVTVMVQKEAAERLCADIPSRACGAVTYAVAYYCDAKTLFDVGRDAFYPVPAVDSCVIQLTPRVAPPVAVDDEDFFFRVVKAGFSQRRKTLLNSLSSGLGVEKSMLAAAMDSAGITINARMEQLSFAQTAELSRLLKNQYKK